MSKDLVYTKTQSHLYFDILQHIIISFTSDLDLVLQVFTLVCSEKELSVIDIPKGQIEELFTSGKIKELQALIDVSWGDSKVSLAMDS